jgi:ribosome-associated protein
VTKNTKVIENEQIVEKIVEGIQERKGKGIVVVNMKKLKEAPCSYFVICEGDSNVHVNAVALSIKDFVNEKINVKPFATDGFENCEWIAMDYGQIIVHVFQRPAREFYDIEHLWADAELQQIENLN